MIITMIILSYIIKIYYCCCHCCTELVKIHDLISVAGNRFALMETKLILVYMLSQFKAKPVAKTPKKIKIVQKGFNMSIAGGFWMGLESRK
jgi:hypothetical protein